MTKDQAIEQARFIKRHYVARMVFIYSKDGVDFETLCCSTWAKPRKLVEKGYIVIQLDYSGN